MTALEVKYRDAEERERTIRTNVPDGWLTDPKLHTLLAIHIGQVRKVLSWTQTEKGVSK